MYFGDYSFFFFNDTATTEIYTLSLHDALPIYALKDLLVNRQELKNVVSINRVLNRNEKSGVSIIEIGRAHV